MSTDYDEGYEYEDLDGDEELTEEESALFDTFLEAADGNVGQAIQSYAAFEQAASARVGAQPEQEDDSDYEEAVEQWFDDRPALEQHRDVIETYVSAAAASGSDDPWAEGEAAFYRANDVLTEESTRKGHKTRPGTFEDAIDAAYQDNSIGRKAAPEQPQVTRRRQSATSNAIDDWAAESLGPANELRKQARREINHQRRQDR